jgi:DNA-binding GntR family transcriptional regulator
VISASDLAKLDALIATMEAAQAAGDGKRYVPANRDFHFTVYRAAESETLLSIIESLWLRIGPYFDLLNAAGGLRASNAEHRRIRDALGRGDGLEARAALKSDIEGAAKTLRALLP